MIGILSKAELATLTTIIVQYLNANNIENLLMAGKIYVTSSGVQFLKERLKLRKVGIRDYVGHNLSVTYWKGDAIGLHFIGVPVLKGSDAKFQVDLITGHSSTYTDTVAKLSEFGYEICKTCCDVIFIKVPASDFADFTQKTIGISLVYDRLPDVGVDYGYSDDYLFRIFSSAVNKNPNSGKPEGFISICVDRILK